LDGSRSIAANGRTLVSYEWKDGGNHIGSGKIINHVLDRPGTHSSALTVTDDNGVSAVETREIDISASTPWYRDQATLTWIGIAASIFGIGGVGAYKKFGRKRDKGTDLDSFESRKH
jgi:hypothetical protein